MLTGTAARAVHAMREFELPWHLAGGWAIDLHLGRQTREHHDVDIVIDRDDQVELRRFLAGHTWLTSSNRQIRPAPAGKLSEGDFQLFIDTGEEMPTWSYLLEPRQPGLWLYRRDPRITLDAKAAFLEKEGIPYLAPEIVLLFKAKYVNDAERQDGLDFENALPGLDPRARSWLKRAIERADPDHPWLDRLCLASQGLEGITPD